VIINWGRGPYWNGPGFVRTTPFPPRPSTVSKSGSDSLAVALSESANVVIGESQSANDDVNISITDTAGVAAPLAGSDSVAVSATESANRDIRISGTDSLDVALSESARLASNRATIVGSDTLAAALTESASKTTASVVPPISITGSRTEYIGGPVYIGQGRKFIPRAGAGGATDSIGVSLAESANVAVHLSASDDIGVGTTPGSSDDVVTPVPFGQTLVTSDTLSLGLTAGSLVSNTSGTVVNWTTLIDPNLSIRVFEEASIVTINNQRLYNEVVGLRLIEHASRLHIFPTGGTTPPTVGDNVNVGLGEGFQNSFTGLGASRLGTYGYLKIRIIEHAAIGIASIAQAFNTTTWLDVAFTGQGAGVLLSQIGIEVIYTRVPARTTTDTAWPTTAQIQQDYPEESYVDFSFTG